MDKNRKTTDRPIQGVFNKKITLVDHREIFKKAGQDKSGRPKSKVYADLKKKVKREELDSILAKVASHTIQKAHKSESFTTTKSVTKGHTHLVKSQLITSTPKKSVFTIINDKRNTETISNFSSWFSNTAINTLVPSMHINERERLSAFIGLLVGEVLSFAFKEEVQFLRNIEVFISVAQKVYKMYVRISHLENIEIDEKFELATDIDLDSYGRFINTHSEILSRYYDVNNPIGFIER